MKSQNSSAPANSSDHPRTLTRAEARAMIEKMRQDDISQGHSGNWVIHSLAVGDTAARLAAAMGLDEDFAATLGYIHDIGKGLGTPEDHILSGYHYLHDIGYADDFCNICLIHSFFDKTPELISGYFLDDEFLTEFLRAHERTIYEKIVSFCDCICLDRPYRLEERLINTLLRHGTSDHTQLHLKQVYTLKAELEAILGNKINNVLKIS